MKRNILFVLAAVLVCGLSVTLLTQCKKNKTDVVTNPEVTIRYYVAVSPDVLNVANVEINYLDATGAKQKEILTSTEWNKPITANTLPLTEGVWAKITPKASIADGEYLLKVQTAASYMAKLANGTETHEAWGNDFDEVIPAENADEVAAWCAKSPTVAITLNEAGNAQLTTVDFGGNAGSDGGGVLLCELFCWIWDLDPAVYCAK